MPAAEIITIGTEILLGEILDTNAQFIARKLRDSGIDLYRKTSVGDNHGRIADAIRQALERCEIIITTGGLGPTVDDPTRQGVALAMNVELEYREELWDQIQKRFRRFNREPTENNKSQAYVPRGAIVIENPVGTAPAFIVESGGKSVISLPGVPLEMEYLFENEVQPYLSRRFNDSGVIKTRTLHTVGAGESQIDDRISDLENWSNPTVGLAAHTGQVDVRITAKATSENEADRLITQVEEEINRRLGDWIYGVDQETLNEAALRSLIRKGWSLAVVEAGLLGELINQFAPADQQNSSGSSRYFRGGKILISPPEAEQFLEFVREFHRTSQADVCLGVAIYPGQEKQEVLLVLVSPEGEQSISRPFGGPSGNAPRWAMHHSLDFLRRL
jgi:competence/damage-inducible protein CinA-like protein